MQFLKSSHNYKHWDKWSIIPWKRHLTNQKWQTVRHTALPSIKAAACLVSAVARRQNIQLTPSRMLASHSYATSRRAQFPLCGLPCHSFPISLTLPLSLCFFDAPFFFFTTVFFSVHHQTTHCLLHCAFQLGLFCSNFVYLLPPAKTAWGNKRKER